MGEEDGGSHLREGVGAPVRIGGEQGFAVAVSRAARRSRPASVRAGPGVLCGRGRSLASHARQDSAWARSSAVLVRQLPARKRDCAASWWPTMCSFHRMCRTRVRLRAVRSAILGLLRGVPPGRAAATASHTDEGRTVPGHRRGGHLQARHLPAPGTGRQIAFQRRPHGLDRGVRNGRVPPLATARTPAWRARHPHRRRPLPRHGPLP